MPSFPQIFLLAPLLALAACGGTRDRAAEEARLMQTSRDWARAAGSGNIDAILSYWADDAVAISPGEPEMRGKAALRSYLERSFRTPGFRISWEPQRASVSDDGSMGYLVERTRVSFNGPEGKPVVEEFRGITVWRRQADGTWKNVVDISNAPPPAPAR
jgi:ketosteroid isomerase-like protein